MSDYTGGYFFGAYLATTLVDNVVGWKIINIDNVYKFVLILFIPLLKR